MLDESPRRGDEDVDGGAAAPLALPRRRVGGRPRERAVRYVQQARALALKREAVVAGGEADAQRGVAAQLLKHAVDLGSEGARWEEHQRSEARHHARQESLDDRQRIGERLARAGGSTHADVGGDARGCAKARRESGARWSRSAWREGHAAAREGNALAVIAIACSQHAHGGECARLVVYNMLRAHAPHAPIVCVRAHVRVRVYVRLQADAANDGTVCPEHDWDDGGLDWEAAAHAHALQCAEEASVEAELGRRRRLWLNERRVRAAHPLGHRGLVHCGSGGCRRSVGISRRHIWRARFLGRNGASLWLRRLLVRLHLVVVVVVLLAIILRGSSGSGAPALRAPSYRLMHEVFSGNVEADKEIIGVVVVVVVVKGVSPLGPRRHDRPHTRLMLAR